jgi:hypothetical protein
VVLVFYFRGALTLFLRCGAQPTAMRTRRACSARQVFPLLLRGVSNR